VAQRSGVKKDRTSFAKLQILRYVEKWFTCLADLVNPDIEGLINMPAHGLSREELLSVLDEMFQAHVLVAKKEGRGLFTPTRLEIENALAEPHGRARKLSNTFYGLTSGANELFNELRQLYAARAT
jgi:hypothetical protein